MPPTPPTVSVSDPVQLVVDDGNLAARVLPGQVSASTPSASGSVCNVIAYDTEDDAGDGAWSEHFDVLHRDAVRPQPFPYWKLASE
jgi:hypothetical protein